MAIVIIYCMILVGLTYWETDLRIKVQRVILSSGEIERFYYLY